MQERKEPPAVDTAEDPVHANVRLQAAELYIDANALIRKARDGERIHCGSRARYPSMPGGPSASASQAADDVSTALQGLESLLDRNLETNLLVAECDRKLSALVRQRQQELDAVLLDRQTQLDVLTRDVIAKQEFHDMLGENANQAALAKAQLNDEDVRLAASAAPPEHPVPRGTATKPLWRRSRGRSWVCWRAGA